MNRCNYGDALINADKQIINRLIFFTANTVFERIE